MSTSQEAAKARDIIRRRQRQGRDDRAPAWDGNGNPSAANTSLSPVPSRRNLSVSPTPGARGTHPKSVRITVSHQRGDDGRGGSANGIETAVETTSHFHGSSSSSAAYNNDPPLIYSVPTTDTFGDNESLVLRPVSMPTSPVRSHPRWGSNSHLPPSSSNAERPPPGNSDKWAKYQNFRRTGVRRNRKKGSSNKPRDFQHDEDAASVTVQTVNVAQRSAFERRPPLSLEVWKSIADDPQGGRRKNMAKRMSPSLQHLKLLHVMQSMAEVRQVKFSASTCLAADLFGSSWDPNNSYHNGSAGRDANRSAPKRDGRYRPIDPVRATVAALPLTPPVLSNKRRRLPRRSDVGFPNATADEVRAKQMEIANETEWEEASPRLVVLVTSDDLGKAVLEESDADSGSVGSDGACASAARGARPVNCSPEHMRFNGGGLPSMPFAGRELIQAKEQNARHFGRAGANPSPHLERFLAPDPYSMLAPPLDAVYSPSQGWRPRPFHDRPAGMRYCLVSPLSVSPPGEDHGNTPLVCSMALYSLPTAKANKQHSNRIYGKMSEEFMFPAGDWTGVMPDFGSSSARHEENRPTDPTLAAALAQKRTKAIFSFDPMALDDDPGSLHVVVQVFRVDREAGNGPGQRRQEAQQPSDEKIGSQLLSPVCFGVSPLYASEPKVWGGERMQWPLGETRNLSFHYFPLLSESQDAFVARLTSVLLEGDKHSRSLSADAIKSDSLFSPETQSKRRGVGRLFKVNPKPSSQPALVESAVDGSSSSDSHPGGCSLFVSSLSADFLQALLAEPRELDSGSAVKEGPQPKLLVDVTGDLAVALDSSVTSRPPVSDSPRQRKRSNLKRLPASSEPAGYLRMSEYREVLYLPARPEKHYDVDFGQPYRSLFNLLYLYPRVLRLMGDSRGVVEDSHYTIRIQVLQTKAYADDASTQATPTVVTLKAFHSPSPWCGPTLLDQIFTKPFGGPTSNTSTGISVRDEIKARLPPVLDGSFSMRFELYRIEHDSSGNMALISTALIPLSSSHSREVGRVATIIPNGNHRLKLGDYQLQLETRLVSAIHVGDASVATVLRDFPCEVIDRADEKALFADLKLGQSSIHSSMNAYSFDDSFVAMLAEASPGAVTCHFEVLLFIHLCNVVTQIEWRGSDSHRNTSAFLRKNMMCLFEVLRKVKERFRDPRGGYRHDMLRAFIKRHLDAHDESFLGVSRTVSPPALSNQPHAEVDSAVDVAIDPSVSHDDSGVLLSESEDAFHEVAVRIKAKPELSGSPRGRHNRSAPFSRVAYGATKMDRMRVEAEHHGRGALRSHFFEDDETIATTPTLQTIAVDVTGAEMDAEGHAFPKILQSSSSNSIVRAAPASSHNRQAGKPVGGEFAQRVRTVAQVVLAPCVGPSLSNILAKSTSPQSVPRVDKAAFDSAVHASHDRGKGDLSCRNPSDSDSDGGDDFRLRGQRLGRAVNPSTEIKPPVLMFSVSIISGSETSLSSCDYEYESIMLLWQNAWLEYVEKRLVDPPPGPPGTQFPFTTFPIPPYLGESASQAPIFAYYANMDFLLPLCLKSLVLRYSVEVLPFFPISTKALLDDAHITIFEHLFEILARGLLGLALYGMDTFESREKAIIHALTSADVVLDFIVGLFGVLHPEHINSLLKMFFKTLRDGEIEHLHGNVDAGTGFEWSAENLQRVRASRQLRLRTVEALSVLPSFISVNFPRRPTSDSKLAKVERATWCHQCMESKDDFLSEIPEHSERLPLSGWLADMLLTEALSICALSCEAVVAEAIAHVELSAKANTAHTSIASTLKKRPGAKLRRSDLLMFQSISVHAISCVYELLLRRHSMDKRFQSESGRDRIAGLFAVTILDKSLTSSRWLARMESTHKVRSLWLLCFVYVLQESPVQFISKYIRSICSDSDAKIHRFIRLLRLSSSTFQSFVDLPRHANFPSEVDKGLSPWLLQESFNTVVAATIMVVEQSAPLLTNRTLEKMKVLTGIMDLLLHLLSTPQSVVTHLRAMGGALQCLDRFGVEDFLEAAGSSVQHWFRVVICLMNSTSLAVRAVAVDFVISLLGYEFDRCGDLDSLATVFVTVLPEVAAREIALCSVSGLVSTSDDLSRCLWPLRRALADLEGANPLDDDRVDPSLTPILSVLSRACQAVLDSVLIELRLKGPSLTIVGAKIRQNVDSSVMFDADEESLFEAASFFESESAPMQRLRWLLTLKELHEAKGNWLEAAETLYLCSMVLADSMEHLKHVWRPSTFALWSDSRRSIWLDTVGEELGQPDRGNMQVMEFAEQFLEPSTLFDLSWKPTASGKLRQPTLSDMTVLWGRISTNMMKLYRKEEGFVDLTHLRLGSVLKDAVRVLERHASRTPPLRGAKWTGPVALTRHMEDEKCYRRLVASISGDISQLSETWLKNGGSPQEGATPTYVALRLSGKEPQRFRESTALPTFLDRDAYCVCRVPQNPRDATASTTKDLVGRFGSRLAEALKASEDEASVVLVTDASLSDDIPNDESVTYLHVYPVESFALTTGDGTGWYRSKSFFYRKTAIAEGGFPGENTSTVVELKVAHEFPYALSRQRVVLTSEIGFHG